MHVGLLYLSFYRKKKSYDYKFNRRKNDFRNNVKNNCLDIVELKHIDGRILFSYNHIQTVSNHPYMDYFDTINTGEFQIKCFVDKRQYEDDGIHGIINAKDIEGQSIGLDSMQKEEDEIKGRWLIHSARHKGKDLKNAYSGACLVFLEWEKLKEFNDILRLEGIKKGDIIDCILTEI